FIRMNTYSGRVVADLTRVFKALADPTRQRLAHVLRVEELTVGELGDVLDLPQSTVSRHLAILRDADMAADRREGTRAFYRLRADFADRHPEILSALEVEIPEAESDLTRVEEIVARRATDLDVFDRLAPGWESLRASQVDAIVTPKAVTALVPAELFVVDVGCGTGTVLADLSRIAREVHAVDVSDRMLRTARKHAAEHGLTNVEFHKADMADLPFDSGTADAVLLALVLRHAVRPTAAIREAARILRSGGKVVIVDFVTHQDERFRTELDHQWLGFAQRDVADWLDAAGVTLVGWNVLASPDRSMPASFIAEGQRVPGPGRAPIASGRKEGT
ncbi:MAG: methyltransferase domain-containing protein, partial [Actinobacteria bacterium ATB1]|nr:methyltransferase domain-containing protein [Actinobacteria bacterium ATB1]